MENNTKYVGASPLFMIFIVFLVLKLTNTVPWSWWLITLPLWIGVPIFFIFLVIILIIAIISLIFN